MLIYSIDAKYCQRIRVQLTTVVYIFHHYIQPLYIFYDTIDFYSRFLLSF